jgi:hypothetical protein
MRIVDALAALGFHPSRHSYRMEIALDGEEREPSWPAGITVRAVAEGEQRLVHSAMVEVWQDTNDPFDETYEEWAHWHLGRPSYDPSLWFLAFAEDELAGFSVSAQDSRSWEFADPGGGRASARRCSCVPSQSFVGLVTRVGRWGWTQRA